MKKVFNFVVYGAVCAGGLIAGKALLGIIDVVVDRVRK